MQIMPNYALTRRAFSRAERPKNTSLAYKPKQKEFTVFCKQKQYYNGDTVTEEKLLLFLVEEVVGH